VTSGPKRALAALVLVAAVLAGLGWRRKLTTAAAIEAQRVELAALEAEHEGLQRRLDELLPRDQSLAGMPHAGLRLGIPTSLTQELIRRVTAGLVDQVTLVLEGLRVRKTGSIKKVVTLGEYDLDVRVDQVVGRLRTGEPTMVFGGNQVKVALPISVASGSGRARIHFKWEGRSVAGAVCGDLDITREVTGGVKPDRYEIAGTLVFSRASEKILATPRFRELTVNLKVVPSAESWAAVLKVVGEKEGVCGFVLDKVDVLQIVRRIVDKGFNVRLPTERLKAVAIPVGIEPSVTLGNKELTLGLRVEGFSITDRAIWLGADVGVRAAAVP
jgi:hypothetical protein